MTASGPGTPDGQASTVKEKGRNNIAEMDTTYEEAPAARDARGARSEEVLAAAGALTGTPLPRSMSRPSETADTPRAADSARSARTPAPPRPPVRRCCYPRGRPGCARAPRVSLPRCAVGMSMSWAAWASSVRAAARVSEVVGAVVRARACLRARGWCGGGLLRREGRGVHWGGARASLWTS